MKKAGIILGSLGALILLAVLAMMPTPPARLVDAAALRASANAYSAKIVRDTLGVPHVSGKRDADAAFGLAYAHSEDDWQTIQAMLLASRGDLGRYEGKAGVLTDYLVQLFRIRELVEEKYESDLSAQTRALLDGYVAGLNLYALDHPEGVRPGLLPITAKDVVAGFVLRAPFFYGLEDELTDLNADQPTQTISLRDSESAFLSSAIPNPELGSNAFAIASKRALDGVTRLVINSHQPYSGPVAWYEIQVTSEEGWNAAGGIFPGTPVILHGFNQNLGWAHTVNKPDLIDIYVLKINPKNKNEYWFDGAWKSFERSTAHMRIKLWGPFSVSVPRAVLWSVHGPVFPVKHGTYAVRFSGLYEIRAVEQWYRMNKAQNFDAWQAAMAINAIPSLNVVYGDKDGNIGYFYNAKMPKRQSGFNWQSWLPGDTSRALWQGFEAPSTLPKVINPVSGFVANANNTPFRASGAGDDPNPAAFSVRYGIEHYMTNRGHRLIELLDTPDLLGEEDVLRIKYDLAYSFRSEVARLVREITAMDLTYDPQLEAAQALLLSWDMRTDQHNKAAALGVLLALKCIKMNADGDPWLMDPEEALKATAEDLTKHYGRLDVPWGDISRMRRGKVDVPIDGGPDILRAVYSAGHELEADGKLTAVAGDTYIALVSWDNDGQMRAQTRHQFGSATLDENNPHFDDQATPFAQMKLRPFPFTPEVLAKEAKRTYQIGGKP
jgi:penicillin amidase/acyl-homoserine-lactone acylase